MPQTCPTNRYEISSTHNVHMYIRMVYTLVRTPHTRVRPLCAFNAQIVFRCCSSRYYYVLYTHPHAHRTAAARLTLIYCHHCWIIIIYYITTNDIIIFDKVLLHSPNTLPCNHFFINANYSLYTYYRCTRVSFKLKFFTLFSSAFYHLLRTRLTLICYIPFFVILAVFSVNHLINCYKTFRIVLLFFFSVFWFLR